MTIALTLTCLALVGLLAYRERVGARERSSAQERLAEAEAGSVRAILHLSDRYNEERVQHAQERRELYQRIQAPEVAVAEAVREARGPYVRRKPIGADDDEAFHVRNGGATEVEGG